MTREVITDFITIEGGHPLNGTVEVRGAKNAVPKEMMASLLTSESCILSNVSTVLDFHLMVDLIRAHGGKVSENHDSVEMTSSRLVPLKVEDIAKFSGISRLPILLCGVDLHRFGRAVVPGLGGCDIGSRPVDFHLNALKLMGANVEEEENRTVLTANKLSGARIKFPYPSVMGTEQVLLAASLAEGVTSLENAAIEPEILDLVSLLNQMGAKITVNEIKRSYVISGVSKLSGYKHRAITDRIEVGSWAAAAVATNGEIFVKNAKKDSMKSFLKAFERIGGAFEITEEGIKFYRQNEVKPLLSQNEVKPLLSKNGQLKPIELRTDVHPGFMTDWQQPFVVALTQAIGSSRVHETVYEERFGYTKTLNEMGANIKLSVDCTIGDKCRYDQKNHLHSAEIKGPTPLQGLEMTIPDLRAGFAYVIAALVAKGESKIHNIKIIDRGYENFREKLYMVGARVIS